MCVSVPFARPTARAVSQSVSQSVVIMGCCCCLFSLDGIIDSVGVYMY